MRKGYSPILSDASAEAGLLHGFCDRGCLARHIHDDESETPDEAPVLGQDVDAPIAGLRFRLDRVGAVAALAAAGYREGDGRKRPPAPRVGIEKLPAMRDLGEELHRREHRAVERYGF